MKVKWFCILMVFVFLALTSTTVLADKYISLGTCSPVGTYYPIGGAISYIWNTKLSGIDVTAESSGCSMVNLRLIQKGQMTSALVQNDAAYFAYHGEEFFKGTPVTKLRGIACLYPEIYHLVTLRNDIKSFEDLKGKTFCPGNPGGIETIDLINMLKAYDNLNMDDIKIQQVGYSVGVQRMKDGLLDAMMMFTGAPGSTITELSSLHNVNFVPIEEEKANKIHEISNFIVPAIIPAGTYKGQEKEVPTVAVRSMVVISSDVDDELVYKMTKALFENLDVIVATHKRGESIKLETALEGMSIPLHPGAEKYYKEVGLLK